ncbi:MAG: outer membrane beta-barrel protein, partial [Flavisolibacter sp.]
NRWMLFIPLLLFCSLNTFIGYRNGTDRVNSNVSSTDSKINIQPSPIDIAYNKIETNSNKVPLIEKRNDGNTIISNSHVSVINKMVRVTNNYYSAKNPHNTISTNRSENNRSENNKLSIAVNSSSTFDYTRPSYLQLNKMLNNKQIQLNPIEFTADPVELDHNTPPKSGNKKQHFYAGLIGGLDYSTVKFQTVSDFGFTAGALIGYSFNHKWSIEIAVLYDKKSYYSDGKYFNSKLYPNNSLYSVDGICHMIELPLNVKYNFATLKKNSFFTELGISSYLMKMENYNYIYMWNGQLASGSKIYNNSSRNWLSIMNFSVGYQHKMGNHYDLRIEPYFKAPLKGVGIGELPITSFGLNIAVTRPIF